MVAQLKAEMKRDEMNFLWRKSVKAHGILKGKISETISVSQLHDEGAS